MQLPLMLGGKGLVAVVTLAALGLVWLWSTQRARKRQRAARWSTLALDCTSGQHATASIFMILLCRGPQEVQHAAHTLLALFDQSACPMHLTVGLYEVVPDLRAASAVLARYTALLPSAQRLGRSFAERVRVVKVPASRAMAPDAARGFVMSHAYNGEAFVGTVAAGVLAREGWDTLMLNARRRAANPLAIVVCAAAAPAQALSSSPRGDKWSELLGSLGQALSSSSASSCEPSFFVAREARSEWPRISARTFARTDADHPQPSLFWSGELSLGSASAVVNQPNGHALGHPAPFGQGFRTGSMRDTDYCTTVALWTAGWDFVSPSVPCGQWTDAAAIGAYDAPAPCARPSVRETWLASLDHRPRSVQDFAAFSATDPAAGRVFARAALGVSPQHNQREIQAKYGSQSGFSAERDALLFELQQ